MKQKESEINTGDLIFESTKQTEDLQWTKYRNQGHGFAAEDYNAWIDRYFHWKKVEKVGVSNEKNGPDRIVNSCSIQSKYCESASKTVNAAFDKTTGFYRYGKMKLEVPKEQYLQAIEEFKKKILEGKVPGVTDSNEAEKMILKGHATYKQAMNLAKAGNIDSLIFDFQTQSVIGLYGFSISFIIQYATLRWAGKKSKEALKLSVMNGLKTGSLITLSGVFTQQFLRTSIGRSAAASTFAFSKRIIDKLYKNVKFKKIIDKLATFLKGKMLSGAAAKNTIIKFLRTNIVTISVSSCVMSIPDLYKLLTHKISGKQFFKNTYVSCSGILAGSFGAMGGLYLGGIVGTVLGGGPGMIIGSKIGSFICSLLSSFGVTTLSKFIADCISEDDMVEMKRISTGVISELCDEWFISNDEFENIKNTLQDKMTQKWFQKMFQSSFSEAGRKKWVYQELNSIFEETAKKRVFIKTPRRCMYIISVHFAKLRIFYNLCLSKFKILKHRLINEKSFGELPLAA